MFWSIDLIIFEDLFEGFLICLNLVRFFLDILFELFNFKYNGEEFFFNMCIVLLIFFDVNVFEVYFFGWLFCMMYVLRFLLYVLYWSLEFVLVLKYLGFGDFEVSCLICLKCRFWIFLFCRNWLFFLRSFFIGVVFLEWLGVNFWGNLLCWGVFLYFV